MKTEYSDAEIEALVQDVKQAFLDPAFQALAKAQSEKEVKTDKEAGNGTTPTPDVKRPAGEGERAATLSKDGQPSKSGSGAGTNVPTAKAEEDGSPEKKEPAPSSEPAESAASASPEPSASPAPDASASPTPDESAPMDPGAQGQDPAMAGGEGGIDLVSAYKQLDDETLKAHYDALKTVLMERMGAGQQDPSAQAQPAAPAPAPDMGMGAAPSPSPSPAAPAMAMKSEELSKAEAENAELKKAVSGITEVISKLLSQPKPRAITSQDQLAKSEVVLTKDQVEKKLLAKATETDLKKSDRELLLRYFTPNSKMNLSEVEHLLK